MIVVSYGAGTDSTAMLIEAHRRGIRPDLIVWADTGSEHPRTYAYIGQIQAWLEQAGFPELTITRWIRRDGRFTPLHEVCEDRNELPSAAYGFAGCSSKWKRQPVDKLVDNHPAVVGALAVGETVERWVGYNVEEQHRIGRLPKREQGQPYLWRAPLAEWDLDRRDARQTIWCAGLPLPGKSACWLCPHSKPSEVIALRDEHPDLYGRAVAIEANAELTTVKGLGRQWRWADAGRQMQLAPVRLRDDEGDDLPCSCSTFRQPQVPPATRQRPYRPRRARLDPWRWALGVLPAPEIARLAGVTPATVRKMRARQQGSDSRALRT